MKAFSDQVIPLLTKCRIPLQLSDPSPVFTKNILRKIQTDQIVSLKMKMHSIWRIKSLDWLMELTSITSLTLYNPHQIDGNSRYTSYLPNLTRLALFYEYEISFDATNNILGTIQSPIQRLKIHGNEIRCGHRSWLFSPFANSQNLTIKYLLVDINYASLPSWNPCSYGHQFCFLNSTIALMKRLPKIQQVRFITSIHNVQILLDAAEWRTLFSTCSDLHKIRIDILQGILDKGQLLQKVVELQKILQNEQPKIKVQFVCL